MHSFKSLIDSNKQEEGIIMSKEITKENWREFLHPFVNDSVKKGVLTTKAEGAIGGCLSTRCSGVACDDCIFDTDGDNEAYYIAKAPKKLVRITQGLLDSITFPMAAKSYYTFKISILKGVNPVQFNKAKAKIRGLFNRLDFGRFDKLDLTDTSGISRHGREIERTIHVNKGGDIFSGPQLLRLYTMQFIILKSFCKDFVKVRTDLPREHWTPMQDLLNNGTLKGFYINPQPANPDKPTITGHKVSQVITDDAPLALEGKSIIEQIDETFEEIERSEEYLVSKIEMLTKELEGLEKELKENYLKFVPIAGGYKPNIRISEDGKTLTLYHNIVLPMVTLRIEDNKIVTYLHMDKLEGKSYLEKYIHEGYAFDVKLSDGFEFTHGIKKSAWVIVLEGCSQSFYCLNSDYDFKNVFSVGATKKYFEHGRENSAVVHKI